MGAVYWQTLRRDFRLMARQKSDWLNPLMFFLIVLTLFPLGVGAKPNLLREIAPGIIWIAALLSVLLGSERLFRQDYKDGVLEQLVAARSPLLPYVLAKISASWCASGLPLIIMSPLMALLLGLDTPSLIAIIGTLLLGTPLLSLLSALGAALNTISRKRRYFTSLGDPSSLYSVANFCQCCCGTSGLWYGVFGAVGRAGCHVMCSVGGCAASGATCIKT